MKRVTMADVAKKANVSKSTVSQYVNNRFDYMGLETKERIREAIEELGYQVNVVARSLTQKRTSTIGVIVANILHTFSTQVIRSIEDICHEQDIHVIVCNADDNSEKEKKYIEMLMAKQVDGIIVFPTGGNMALYREMLQNNYPLVFMDRIVEGLEVDTVLLDNMHASHLAVNHLIEKGHERIAMVTTSLTSNITPRIERVKGYKDCLQSHGIIPEEQYILSRDLDEIKDSVAMMMGSKKPPTAIFTGNDLSLIEVLKFIKENKIVIPKDISLISIDDVSFANIYTPTITTIAQPSFEMGKAAAQCLLNKINKKEDQDNSLKVLKFKGELITRESCR